MTPAKMTTTFKTEPFAWLLFCWSLAVGALVELPKIKSVELSGSELVGGTGVCCWLLFLPPVDTLVGLAGIDGSEPDLVELVELELVELIELELVELIGLEPAEPIEPELVELVELELVELSGSETVVGTGTSLSG